MEKTFALTPDQLQEISELNDKVVLLVTEIQGRVQQLVSVWELDIQVAQERVQKNSPELFTKLNNYVSQLKSLTKKITGYDDHEIQVKGFNENGLTVNIPNKESS